MEEFKIHLKKKSVIRTCKVSNVLGEELVDMYDENENLLSKYSLSYVKEMINKGTWGYVDEKFESEFYPKNHKPLVIPQYALDLKEKLEEVQDRNEDLHTLLKREEDLIKDCYHYIELGSLNAVESAKVTKVLKTCLIKRREIRDEIAFTLTILKSTKGLSEKIEELIDNRTYRSYTYRVSSLKDILGE